MLMVADDTFCVKSDQDLHNLIQYINGEINKMAVWFRANKLAVIVTKDMIFWTSGKQIRNDTPDLIYNAADPNDSLNPQLVHTL